MKTVLITGATSGIGEALVKQFLEEDCKVIACGRDEEKLRQLAAKPMVWTLAFDVTDRQATARILGGTQCDIAILNAGVCEYIDMDAFDADAFERVFSVNFFGVVNCVSALLPTLSRGNQLVIVDSLARLLPFTQSEAYGASKAAMHYFTKSLTVDLASKGVLVQSVSPGFVKTPLTDQNDFSMPMRISAEQAADSLLKGVQKRRQSIYFPYIFSLAMRILSRLPDRLKVAVSKQLSKKSNQQASR